MANNQLATAINGVTLWGAMTEEDIQTVRETIAKDCNESQFKLFMGIARAMDANPLIGEIHPSVYQGKLTTQYGIELYVRKAKEAPGYMGYDVQIVFSNDEFKFHQERAEDGRYYIVIDEHTGGFPRGHAVGGYAMAYKEGLKPFTVLMDVEEVDHYKKSSIGMQKTMWTNNFNDMFKKHMVKRALKAAFGLGMDSDDEGQSLSVQDTPSYEPQRVNVTPPEEKPKEPEVVSSGGKKKPASEADPELERLRAEMAEKLNRLGIKKADIPAYIKNACPNMKGEKPDKSELISIIQILDIDIAEKEMDDDLLIGSD